MAKYAISIDGANSMKELANSLYNCTNSIIELSARLERDINSIERDLGIYGDEVLNILIQSKRKIRDSQDSVNILATRISQKGDEILNLLNFNDMDDGSLGGGNNNIYTSQGFTSNDVKRLQPDRSSPRDLVVSQYGFNKDSEGNQVYDSPMEMNDYLYKKQGSARMMFQGTCGLCSCANVLRLAGVNVTEEQMIAFASNSTAPNSIEKLCETGHINPSRNGGTNPEGRRCILEHFGIDSGLFDVELDKMGGGTQNTMSSIADMVSAGKGVILSVHADMLWHDAPYGINDYHAVTVTSVKKDSFGNVLGYYICDSALGGTSFYTTEKLRRSLTGARMNVTHQIIR